MFCTCSSISADKSIIHLWIVLFESRILLISCSSSSPNIVLTIFLQANKIIDSAKICNFRLDCNYFLVLFRNIYLFFFKIVYLECCSNSHWKLFRSLHWRCENLVVKWLFNLLGNNAFIRHLFTTNNTQQKRFILIASLMKPKL